MKSVAQMVSIFESGPTKKPNNAKKMRSPPRLSVPLVIPPKIIMPYGGIPNYYGGAPQKKKQPVTHKSPKYIRNVDVNKPPEKIDKEKIRNNMNNMKVLLEKKGVNKRPFRIAPANYDDNQQDEVFNYNKFLAAKNVFEPKKENDPNSKVYENKPVRKDVKKKAKTQFHE